MESKALLDDRLLAAYRPMRAVAGGDETPWPGTLVRAASGPTCVLVDSRQFSSEWPGWTAGPDGHVLGALDVVRRAEGHDVLIPMCVERADVLVRRREASGAPLSPGEAVTLAVSVLRGFAELTAAPATRGRWWVTDAGRPLFACGVSGDTVATESSELLRLLETPATAATLGEAVQAVLAERPSLRDLEALEQRLFALAGAEPLALTVFGPRRARPASTDAPADDLRRRGRSTVASTDGEPRGLFATISRHVDADLADAASRVATDVWRRVRLTRSGGGRRKPWLIAAGLAAAIVTGGFVWPAGAEDARSADRPAVTETGDENAVTDDAYDAQAAGDDASTSAGSHESTDAAADAPPADADLVAVADGLLSDRAACDGDLGCLASVVEDRESAFPPGVVDLPSDARSIMLVDEFGGVAVLRVESLDGASGAQLVVLVRGGEGWLLRDVYDVENG